MPHQDIIVSGERWPSVTELIGLLDKPFLAKWRGKIGNEEADRIMHESAERGRTVHECVESYLRDGKLSMCGQTEDCERLFRAWHKWWTDQKRTVHSLELKVISKKHKFGGTFDAILLDGNKRILTDWKFSNSDDHFRYLQLAGYALAFYDEVGEKIKEGLIVRVDREGKVYETRIKNLWKYVPLFVALRRIYDFVKKQGKFKETNVRSKRIKKAA